MTASRKQIIYGEILESILPYARNVQTWSTWRRVFTNLHAELELVHNLGRLIVYPEFRDSDVYWLNTQANNYVRQCSHSPNLHPECERIRPLLMELIVLIPNEILHKVTASELVHFKWGSYGRSSISQRLG